MFKGKLSVFLAVAALLLLPAGTALGQEAVPVLISADTPDVAVISDYTDDSGVVHLSGAITYTMSAVAAPAAGTALEGWLVSDDGSVKTSTGVITVDADGMVSHTYMSPDQNLIKEYSSVVITVEPVPDDDAAPSGVIAYGPAVPAAAMAHIRHLLTSWPEGTDKGILTNLQEQLAVAQTHAQLAADSSTLAGVKQHTEHFINAIEGPAGTNYGDLDGDGATQDFGDGVGALTHADDRKHATFAAGEAADVSTIVDNAALVDAHGANAETRATEARDRGLDALGSESLLFAQIMAANAAAVLTAAINGFDSDGDGTIDESTAAQAYTAAQLMATYTLVTGTPEATPDAVGPSLASLSVGDTGIPLVAKGALIAALALISGGGLLILGRRRSKTTA